MKKISVLITAILVSFSAHADGGMWLPSLISQRIGDMQAKGFKLEAEDLYSINQASLKDAVVLFGGGCTGELISAEGLLITNHHCGYSHIQKHSSVEHDYLKDGFWSRNRSEELPCPDLSVNFLDHMTDVTAAVLKGYDPSMSEAQRDSVVKANSAKITEQATAGAKGLEASVESMFMGNQYFLFVYRVYNDVRLVGCPPSSIGKFGGDTDNWMWPRHTGDFSMFRIYAGKDNEPAAYSKDNVPYSPRKFFRISTAGVNEGDFTFIYGFPGSTQEYIHSAAVKYVAEVSDPAKIDLRTLRLDIQKKYMGQSQKVRIQYSSKNASVSNAWKKWQGEAKGIARNSVVAKKQEYEAGFKKWAVGTQYDGLIDKLAELYALYEPYMFAREIFTETAYVIEIAREAASYAGLKDDEARKAHLDAFFKDWYRPIDQESFVAVMGRFAELIPEDVQPDYYKDNLKKYGSVEAWAEDLFSSSAFTSDKAYSLSSDQAKEDPAYIFYRKMYDWYAEYAVPGVNEYGRQINLLNRDYMRGQMEYEKDRAFFPDANLTLRVAYGHVAGYSPADGTYYHHVSTLKGVMEKDNPEIFDYNIPQELRDLYASGDYADTPVCFLATNHTTGGNSGSPVINAVGDLIGINFDRVWEGTMSDIAFDPDFCRNISLDVRYVLFLIRNIGHADNLIDEMVLVD